jgi:micrococcal nuclease
MQTKRIPFSGSRLLRWGLPLAGAIALALTGLSPVAASNPVSPPAGVADDALPARVWGWVDGDTFLARFEDTTVLVRLAGVDAPEIPFGDDLGECYGAESAAQLRKRLPKKSLVWLERDHGGDDLDYRDGVRLRYVWKPRADGDGAVNINLRTIRAGDAFLRSDGQQAQDHKYDLAFAAQRAMKEGSGLWATCQDPSAGWADANDAPAADAPSGAGRSGGGDLDCGDFSTHAEAQAAWEAAGGSSSNNVWGLDHDRDGIACESLG